MAESSLPQQSGATQSDPNGSNGGNPPDLPKRIWLSEAEWTEATDIDMAFFAALRCEDVDNPHKIELLKSVRVRYSAFVYSVERQLHPEREE